MPRGLIVALVLLLAVGGGVWWSEKHPKTEESAKKPGDTPKILSIPESQIAELKITKGPEVIALSKIADKWQIVKPAPMSADAEAVGMMTTILGSLTGDRLIEEKPSNLSIFGLDNPSTRVDITKKDGKTETLIFGADTVMIGNSYVKVGSSPAVYTIASATKSMFDKTLNDLRDKRLLSFNPEKVTSVSLTPMKGSGVEFAKNGQNDWQIVKPKPYRADNLQVDDLVRKLKDAKLDLTADAAEVAKAFITAAKVANISVTDNAGTQSLEIRKAADKTVYAKGSIAAGAYKVIGDLGDGLDKSAEDFRNKKLFDFGFNDPTKVEFAGTAYERQQEKWTSAGKPLDPPSMQAVVDKLRDLTATKFADAPEGTPYLSVSVTYGDQRRLEKVTVTRSGASYLAQRDGEPGIYVLESKNVDELQKAIAGIKPAQPASKQAEKKK